MFLHNDHHFILHPPDLVDALPSICLTSLCPSSYMLGRYDGAQTNGKPCLVHMSWSSCKKYIYLSDYVSIILDVSVGVVLVFLCHLWVEVDAPGKDIV